MAFEVWINRVYANSESIIGVLYANDVQLCFTLELPWKDNQNNTSCIRVGSYTGTIRTDGNKGWRIELMGVPNRTNVQIHIGNYPSDILGCILVGLAWSTNMVSSSDAARCKLKTAYEDAGSPLDINVKFTGYP